MKLQMRCPAKVNLHLQVLGRRSDGYHELRTIFAAVGVWDELSLEGAPAGVLELVVDPEGAVPVGDDNLVVRAARLLAGHLGVNRGARMRVRKGIPVAGGLGGGSSDAAAALVGLARLWAGREEPEELEHARRGAGCGRAVLPRGWGCLGRGAWLGGDGAAGSAALVAGACCPAPSRSRPPRSTALWTPACWTARSGLSYTGG